MMRELFRPSGLILIGALLSTIGAFWSSQQRGNFEQELRNKSEENASLNRELLNNVTGGDSFCYLSLANLDSNSNTGRMVFINGGAFPIFDVSVRIVNLEKFKKLAPHLNISNFQDADTYVDLGTLPTRLALFRGVFPLGAGDRHKFNVFFTARNGSFAQRLLFEKVKGTWTSAIRVVRQDKTLFEQVDPTFPKDQNGHIDW